MTHIPITLAYAPDEPTDGQTHKISQRQLYQSLQIKSGTTIYQALKLCGWLDEFFELKAWCQAHQDEQKPTAKDWRVGIFSQKQPLSYVLQAYDRVEVYRALSIEPMQRRKQK